MSKKFGVAAILCLVFLGTTTGIASTPVKDKVRLDIDWKEFIGKQDVVGKLFPNIGMNQPIWATEYWD